jgi:hypothetical protein
MKDKDTISRDLKTLELNDDASWADIEASYQILLKRYVIGSLSSYGLLQIPDRNRFIESLGKAYLRLLQTFNDPKSINSHQDPSTKNTPPAIELQPAHHNQRNEIIESDYSVKSKHIERLSPPSSHSVFKHQDKLESEFATVIETCNHTTYVHQENALHRTTKSIQSPLSGSAGLSSPLSGSAGLSSPLSGSAGLSSPMALTSPATINRAYTSEGTLLNNYEIRQMKSNTLGVTTITTMQENIQNSGDEDNTPHQMDVGSPRPSKNVTNSITLQQCRENKRLSISEVADQSGLLEEDILCIEQKYYERFASSRQLQAMIESYAKALDLDARPIIKNVLSDYWQQKHRNRDRF